MNVLRYIKIGFVALTVFLGLNNYRLSNKVDYLDNRLAETKHALHYYEGKLNDAEDNNKVLMLTIDDFKESNDSLVKVIRKQAKELKLKDKELNTVSSTEIVIKDTILHKIKDPNPDFLVELKPNQLTTIKIERKDSILTHILDIKNRQDLYISERKVWRKKGFFRRLFTLNFKKDLIRDYQIMNTNPLIKTIETRVITIYL